MALSGNVHCEIAFGKKWKDVITPNGVDLDGTNDYVSTPDAAAHDITGDIEVRAHATAADWTQGAEAETFAAKWDTTSNNRSWQFTILPGGELRLSHSPNGTNAAVVTTNSTVGNSFTDGTTNWVALTLDVSSGDTKFYTFPGVHAAPAALSDWTQLGTTVSGSATSIHSGTSDVTIGTDENVDVDFLGQIHEVEIWNGMKADGGTLVANPGFSDVSQWAIGDAASTASNDAQGTAWTLVNNAAITGSWKNVSTDVTSVRYVRGRLYETDKFEAGRTTIILNNEDRAYEPAFTGGANSPNVIPWAPVRIRAEYGGYSEMVWQGFVESWDVTYPGAATHSICTIQASDAFRLFNRLDLFTYETEVATDSPIGHWKLQETSGTTATDSGSLSVDGTYVNTPTLGATGPITGMLAVNFDDASTEEVNVGTFTGSDVAADFTVECWINLDSGDATTLQALVQIDSEGSGDGPIAFIVDRGPTPNERLAFIVPMTSGWDGDTFSGAFFTADKWAHVAVTVDFSAKSMTAYIDGVATGSFILDKWDQTRTAGTMTVKIAETTSSTVANFDGLISQVAIYNKILSPGRIAAHAEAAAHAFAAATYDTRIGSTLTAVEWGGGSDLRAGQSTLTALTDSDSSVLVALRRAAQSEDGEVLMGRDGRVVGRDRFSRELQTSSNFTFKENFQKVQLGMDDTLIFNQVKIATATAGTLRASDKTSQTSFGPRLFSRTNLDISADDASDMALAIVARFKNPELRIEKIFVRPEGSPATLWPQFRDRDIGDLITFVVEPPPKTGNAINTDLYIERISATVTPETVDIVLQCSPANRQALWILDVSKLNETTVVSY